MTQGNKQSPNQPDSGGNPASPQQEIVAAINSLSKQYETTQGNRKEHDDNVLWWTKRATFGVGFYTLITLGIAVIALCQLQTSRNTERRSLRAYIGINNEKISIICRSCDDPIKYPPSDIITDANMLFFEVKNFGQTPALFVEGVVGLKDMPLNAPLPRYFDYPVGTANERIPGGKIAPFPLDPHDKGDFGFPMGAQQIPLIKRARDKQITLYVYGDLTYIDAFQCTATVLYCYRYEPDMSPIHQFVMCPEHNEPASDCKTKQ